jgi:glutamate 5-kinase
MVTKLAAARICLGAGCRMAIALGQPLFPLAAIENGARCSWFLPQAEPRAARKQWILGSLKPFGTITVDGGAAKALAKGGSLLPAGVTKVEGEFHAGDCVMVASADGRILGRGLAAYDAHDATRLCGRKSTEFDAVLGYRGKDELIHRDDLVLEG